MRPRVAIATCADLYVDEDTPLLLSALERYDLDLDLVAWDDPSYDWGRTDLVVIRSTWDYTLRVEEFRRWFSGLHRVLNDAATLQWNTDKHYLASLAEAGIPIIPTTFADSGVTPIFPAGDFVVKPTVGAGSMGAERYGSQDHAVAADHVARLHGEGRDVMVQPYISDIDELGEMAHVFIDGTLSHVMRKGAMLNSHEADRSQLFRAEQMSLADPDEDAVKLASSVLEVAGLRDALYARVDLVRSAGEWLLMELELTEPSLFLTHHEPAAAQLAMAIAARVGALAL